MIDITDLTSESSSGVFDKMMEGIDRKLTEQFEEGRITGSDYANVYLGGMQVALQESVKFIQVQAQDKINVSQSAQDLALKRSQQELVEQQAQKEVFNVETAKQQSIIAEKEVLLADSRKAKLDAEVTLLQTKALTEQEQIDLVATQKSLYAAQEAGFKFKSATDVLKIGAELWTVGKTSSTAGGPPSLNDEGLSKALIVMINELYSQADLVGTPSFSEGVVTAPAGTQVTI